LRAPICAGAVAAASRCPESSVAHEERLAERALGDPLDVPAVTGPIYRDGPNLEEVAQRGAPQARSRMATNSHRGFEGLTAREEKG
jgi:hypothetical protein